MYAEGIGNFHFSGAKKQDTGFPHCPIILLSHTCLPLSIVLLPNFIARIRTATPAVFSFSFLGNAASNFKSFRVLLTAKTPTPAAWPFHQNPPAYEKSPPYIPMVRPPDNHDELRKFWIAVLFQHQHFAKIGRECFFRPMLKPRHAVIMNLCNRDLQIEV